MTIIESTTAAAIEAALRAKNSIDDGAKDAIERLDEKCIAIEATGLNMSFRFTGGKARVLANIDPAADLTLSGSLSRIFDVMVGKQTDAVSLDGDLTLFEDFRRVFKPAIEAQQLADQRRSAAELGVGTMRSAVEGVASEVTRRTAGTGNRAEIDQLKSHLDPLRPLPEHAVRTLHEQQLLEWTYHSNAIEGNTLTLKETKIMLEGITIGGKSMRDHCEAIDHHEAIHHVVTIVSGEETLCE